MDPVGKAIWYIESHLERDLTLEAVAKASGVSRFHLARAFGYVTGISVMRYVRGRRLTLAAKELANGAPDILTVALDAGYSSHEAFTRAFRDQFGLSPDAIRKCTERHHLNFVEAIKLNEELLDDLEPVKFETRPSFLVAGFSEHYTPETIGGIPSQWDRFAPHIEHFPNRLGNETFGVCYNGDGAGTIDYLAAVAVSDFADLPGEYAHLRIPENRYAVFLHDDHISTIRRTVRTIWGKWLPESNHELADAPDFELYDSRFDGSTGNGGLEIWIPVK